MQLKNRPPLPNKESRFAVHLPINLQDITQHCETSPYIPTLITVIEIASPSQRLFPSTWDHDQPLKLSKICFWFPGGRFDLCHTFGHVFVSIYPFVSPSIYVSIYLSSYQAMDDICRLFISLRPRFSYAPFSFLDFTSIWDAMHFLSPPWRPPYPLWSSWKDWRWYHFWSFQFFPHFPMHGEADVWRGWWNPQDFFGRVFWWIFFELWHSSRF